MNPLGPLQLKFEFEAEDIPLRINEVLIQVIAASCPASIVGELLFKVTITISEAEHPLVGSVTVNV